MIIVVKVGYTERTLEHLPLYDIHVSLIPSSHASRYIDNHSSESRQAGRHWSHGEGEREREREVRHFFDVFPFFFLLCSLFSFCAWLAGWARVGGSHRR